MSNYKSAMALLNEIAAAELGGGATAPARVRKESPKHRKWLWVRRYEKKHGCTCREALAAWENENQQPTAVW